ncbi:hypothetical protein DL770_001045 [Monosporascus sp. CRB-9-2]|nr:hypothetical protein DL770_001045 [Monosporascus sp. CRB-9-2]
MDEYPRGSLDLSVPLLLVSGLTSAPTKPLLTDAGLKEQSTLIRSELPPIDSQEAKTILSYIQEKDAAGLPWNPRATPKRYRFRVKTIAREFLLPPRQARLPEEFEPPPSPATLHSPFSPLTPGSSLYPDGLIDARWLEKHQELLPSVCLSFYNLTSDPTLATLHDNQLKTDINAVRSAIGQSGYRCRLVVVILSDQSPTSMVQFQERLDNIRRAAGLDPKTSLFVFPTRRPESELETAIDSILGAVYDQAVEYYRDLGRHSRKKKGRGIAPQPTVPPTSGTSHTLSLQGWNVRYDFKTAVFAEFRQDVDTALRSYEQAYETLLGTDVLETIPSWSPRFNDARLLADIIAVRILRCLSWSGQSTAAVRRWQAHRDRIADVVDRKGRGTQNYAWKAFEARWAVVMANLIERVKFPELDPSTMLLYRPPEKNLSAERLQPWELLHHPGYWYRAAARHLLDRRKFAHLIPEDDRKAPDTYSAAQLANRAYSHDSYMCPEPYEEYPLVGEGVNHARMIFDHLMLAKTEFQKRRQFRLSAELALDCCRELERVEAWKQIVELLAPLWRTMPFRAEGWWDITEALSWTLRSAAVKVRHAALIVAIDWELLNRSFSKRPDWHYDITKSLDDVTLERPPTIEIGDDDVTSFLQVSFVFRHEDGKAGEHCLAQLSITSNAFASSPPVTLEKVRIEFDGSLRTINLKHLSDEGQAPKSPKPYITHVSLAETEAFSDDQSSSSSEAESQTDPNILLEGTGNLTISPGQTRVFEMDIPLREPGDAKASSVQVSLATKSFKLKYNMEIPGVNPSSFWYTPTSARRVARLTPHVIKILPRPPKMELRLVNGLEQYYTNETIQLEVDLLNGEDADANTKLDVQLYGEDIPGYKVEIVEGVEQSSPPGEEESRLNGLPIGTIQTSGSAKVIITLDPVEQPSMYNLTMKTSYSLVSDPATPIIQLLAHQLNVVTPFEASYDLLPRLHSEWPSLFDYESIQDSSDDDGAPSRPSGLAQKWSLVTRYCSFASEDLSITDLDLEILATHGAVTCTTHKTQPLPPDGQTISPKTIEEAHFDLVAQKASLDDRSPATAEFAFVIRWRRPGSARDVPPNTTTLPIPRFFVTVAEPRVLASVSYSNTPAPSASSSSSSAKPPLLIILDITIENPSSHFLTFGLTMEPSSSQGGEAGAEFAFSGAKTTTLNVLPVSRRSVTYRLLPLVRGAWIRPNLVVRDKYFQKVLRVVPTEGLKGDKDGVLVWVPPLEDDGEDDEEEEDGDEDEDGDGEE